MATLILVRHGERAWNSGNLCALAAMGSSNGADQARRAGELLHRHGIRPGVARTSILHRTIEAARIALPAAGVPDAPTHRSWGLNERHYGALQGPDKTAVRERYGEEQFTRLRRSYDGTPPPLSEAAAAAQRSGPLFKHLDGLPDDEIIGLDVPTGAPLRYEIDDATLTATEPPRYLDPAAADEGIAIVAAQGSVTPARGGASVMAAPLAA